MPTPQCARIAQQANGPASARALPQTKSVHTMCDRSTRNVPTVMQCYQPESGGSMGRTVGNEKERVSESERRRCGTWVRRIEDAEVQARQSRALCPGFTNLEHSARICLPAPWKPKF